MISLIVTFLIAVIVWARFQMKVYSLKSGIEHLCRVKELSWPFGSDIEFFLRFAFFPKSVLRKLSGSEVIGEKAKDLIELRRQWLKFILILVCIWILLNVLEISIISVLE